METSSTPHVVIIGGGFAGLFAARALASAPVRITLLDRHNYHLFQPLLYQVATASLSPADIASPIRWILRHQANVRVLLAEATRIDTTAQRVSLAPSPAEAGHHEDQAGHHEDQAGHHEDQAGHHEDQAGHHEDQAGHYEDQAGHHDGRSGDHDDDSMGYDYLILAPGATHTYFGHPEWAERAPGLKTLDDALEMRRRVLLAFEAAERETDPSHLRRLLTFVIVGGGPTGVELAGALGEIARHSLRDDFRAIRPESARIVLIEGSPYVLGTFPDPLREKARRTLERLGIEVMTDAVVTAIDADGVSWRPASGGPSAPVERIEAETVLWAAGVAASPLAASLGVPLDRAGRVAVQPTLAVPGHPNVFVTGDLCALQQDGKPLPGVAQVAMQEGAHAAQNIARAAAGQTLEPFRYVDYGNMATIGRGAAVAEIFGFKFSGLFAWLIWLFLHIFWLIGFRNRLAVMGEWAWAYITFQRRARLITGDRDRP